mgnify:FL=1
MKFNSRMFTETKLFWGLKLKVTSVVLVYMRRELTMNM